MPIATPDHSLVASWVKVTPKELHYAKPAKDQPHQTLDPENALFIQHLGKTLISDPSQSAVNRWNSLRTTIYNTAVSMYSKKECKNTDWFEESVSTLVPVIDAKRVVLIMYKSNPSQQNPPSAESRPQSDPTNCMLLRQQILASAVKQHPDDLLVQ